MNFDCLHEYENKEKQIGSKLFIVFLSYYTSFIIQELFILYTAPLDRRTDYKIYYYTVNNNNTLRHSNTNKKKTGNLRATFE